MTLPVRLWAVAAVRSRSSSATAAPGWFWASCTRASTRYRPIFASFSAQYTSPPVSSVTACPSSRGPVAAIRHHYSKRRRDPIVVLSELSWPASRQRMPRPPEVMRLGRATSAARNV